MKTELQFNNWQFGKVSNQEEGDTLSEGGKTLNADGILDILNEDGDDPDPIEPKGKDKDDDKEDKLEDPKDEENEIELKDEEDEPKIDDEDVDIIVPVSFKAIEKAYPDIDKKFPQLKAAYYKSQQYTEVFPTVSDAKEASEKAQQLDNFSSDIFGGNLEPLFTTLKANAPKALAKVADNLIQTIAKVDENTALHITGNMLRTILKRAENDGIRIKNDDLQAAAKIINQHVFGDEEIKGISKLAKPDDPKETELDKERADFERERFSSALNTLQGRVDNTIKSTIDANIDPKGTMTAYVKKNASKDAFEQVEKVINKDKAFQSILNNLWRSAKDAKYSSPSLEKIRSAYLNKAKTVLRDAIRSARNEALKGADGKREERDRKGPLPASRGSSSSNTERSGKVKDIPKGMSTKDFLMAD